MHQIGILRNLLVAVIALCLGMSAAQGGVEITHHDGRVHFGQDFVPDALDTGEWSLAMWVFVPETVERPSSMISVGGHLAAIADPTGVSLRVQHGSTSADLRLDSALQAGRWHLLAVSVDRRVRRASAWLGTQGDGLPGDVVSNVAVLRYAGGTTATFSPARPGGATSFGPRVSKGNPTLGPAMPFDPLTQIQPDTAGIIIGSFAADVPAAELVYEALTFRSHALNDADVGEIWASRDYYGPYRLDTRDAGGTMNGYEGAALLALHGMSSRPGGPAGGSAGASWPGLEVNEYNVMVLDRPTPVDPRYSHLFRTVAEIRGARGAVHRSRLEPELDGFFEVEPAPFDAPEQPIGPIGPKTTQLVTGPQGLVRVLVSANSRGTRGTILPQRIPENFAHGVVQAKLSQMAGVLMRPAALLDRRGGWFGLDTSGSTAETVGVRSLHARDDSWADFTRFGSGTMPSSSLGPGAATHVNPGGLYRLRCGPVDGSLLQAEAPLVVRSTLLAFPGSSPLEWYPERGRLQSGPSLRTGDTTAVPLDTTRVTRMLSDRDSFDSPTTLRFDADVDVRLRDAIVVLSGAAKGAVSCVIDVRRESGQTVIELSHPFGEPPTIGAELRIGPWRFESVEHRFEPVPAGDDRTWRGQVLTAPVDASLGVMVYSISAWRPDVDGFIVGSAGQGGAGYHTQLDRAFPGATAAWAIESEVDVWLVGIAGQTSTPESMRDYVDEIRSETGDDVEFVWASDAVHGHSSHERWHDYLADQAEAAGVAAVFAVGHPRVGSFMAQAASGMRADDSHFTPFGNLVIAEAWLDQLRELVGDPCDQADYNQDAVVDVFDLLAFQTDWEAGDPKADLDGDGQFLIFDFLLLLNAIDQCR